MEVSDGKKYLLGVSPSRSLRVNHDCLSLGPEETYLKELAVKLA